MIFILSRGNSFTIQQVSSYNMLTVRFIGCLRFVWGCLSAQIGTPFSIDVVGMLFRTFWERPKLYVVWIFKDETKAKVLYCARNGFKDSDDKLRNERFTETENTAKR
jgi:hypothetical protein